MLHQLPILATRCEGHTDLLDDTCATLVDVEDLDNQFDGLVSFIKGRQERELKAEVAHRKALSEPSADEMANEIYQVHALLG